MDVAGQFVSNITPQTLLAAIVAQYHPDANQEVERLEKKLNKLIYDGTDPVAWGAKIRSLVSKLTLRQAAPSERTVRSLILFALEEQGDYKIRVEIIRHNTPNISLADLWLEVGKLPFPLKRDESAFVSTNQTNSNNKQMSDNKRYDPSKGNNTRGGGSRGSFRGGRGSRGREGPHIPRPRPKQPNTIPTELSREKQQEKDMEEGNCFYCHKAGHAASDCKAREKRQAEIGDSNTQSPTTKSEKHKNKESEKSNYSAYTFFSQDVSEAPKEKEKKKKVATRVNAEPPTTPALAVEEQIVPAEMAQQLKEAWLNEKSIADNEHIATWWMLNTFPVNAKNAISANSVSNWELEFKLTPPITTIAGHQTMIRGENDKVNTEEMDAAAFGCVNLPPGYMYNIPEVICHAMQTVNVALRTKMVILESDAMSLSDNAYGPASIIWMQWRELALYRILNYIWYRNLLKDGAGCDTRVYTWLGIAGLDRTGKCVDAIPMSCVIEMLQENTIAESYFTHCISEMVKIESQLLYQKHKSVGWLLDPALELITGVPSIHLTKLETPTLVSIVGGIVSSAVKMSKTKSLVQVHQVMSILSLPKPIEVPKL